MKKSKKARPRSRLRPSPPFPTCEGKPVSSELRRDPRFKMQLQFLNAYHRVNLEYARLVALRAGSNSGSQPTAERRILKDIESAIVACDALADRHATKGIVPTPTYREAFTVDVSFQHPRPSKTVSSACRLLTIPLPPGLRDKR